MAKVLTQFSSHANVIADTFRAAFANAQVGRCSVEMTAPKDSTHGGLLGLQHATLRTPANVALVVGTIHAGEKKAELRSYTLVARLHEERFKKPPPFAEAEYGGFLAKATPVLAAFGLDVVVVDALPEPPGGAASEAGPESVPPAPVTRWTIAQWVLFLIALLMIVGGGIYWGPRWIRQ